MANMLIPRTLEPVILKRLKTTSKGIIVYGPRQAGKTTLVNRVIDALKLKTLTVSGDRSRFVDILSSRSLGKIKALLSGYQLLFVDEAQRIPEIGINLKIILDSIPEIKVIATGSSSLDLAGKISEPLTGRTYTYKLFPISAGELSGLNNPAEMEAMRESRLIFGSYPEIFSLDSDREKGEYLQLLSDAYLYKDLLDFGGLKNSAKIRDLLKLISFQVGSLVSLTELAASLEMSKDTVAKYLDYLEKSFVIFRLAGFSRNLRKEITKMDKIYFYDLGVRNVVIGNFKPIKDRDDAGRLWENFLAIERIKRQAARGYIGSNYFWRTYTGAEIDWVEESGGMLSGFEFKYSLKTAKIPPSWKLVYPQADFQTVNLNNWQEFIS